MRTSVEKIVASSDVESKVATGVVVNGQTIPADLIIMGVGVVPATSFLTDSGIPLERDGGIKVNEYLKVPGFDGIYAIGERLVLESLLSRFAHHVLHFRRYRAFPADKRRE